MAGHLAALPYVDNSISCAPPVLDRQACKDLHGLGLLLLYYAGVVLAAGNTTCISGQLDWYTNAVGETPCMTYQRLRQICDSAYVVGNFSATTPGDYCSDQISDCCCNSIAFSLSMLCMNCQEDAVAGDIVGFDAAPGTYTTYLAACGTPTNLSLPAGIQQAVCNNNIKIDNFLYNRSYWPDGSWYYRRIADYAVEQQAINNNTFTVCPNQVSPSASLLTSTTVPTVGASFTPTSQKAIIGGAVGGAALAIIAVLGGVYCYWRRKWPRMIQDTSSVFLGEFPGAQPIYGAFFTDTEPVVAQSCGSPSPVRRKHGSRESTLPMTHSLSPERAHSFNTPTGALYLANGNLSETSPCIREDDAGTLILPRDAPTGRLPPAYNPSWEFRITPPSNSNPSEDQVAVLSSDELRSGSLTGIPQEKRASRWTRASD